ncbi:pentatricopeptide repeat-containing protein 1 [Plakobranchus ocellatus]|uniref:Pentatricopeptide repeat-containing protein 1 n=1 Tax=Plakobranchus ocellatus TaxID=259542 RepID=A0AAV3Y6C0_9GAST|nr:pentatricopeptide repeat-containing protein 1 [Plakobranchus ocellatus]
MIQLKTEGATRRTREGSRKKKVLAEGFISLSKIMASQQSLHIIHRRFRSHFMTTLLSSGHHTNISLSVNLNLRTLCKVVLPLDMDTINTNLLKDQPKKYKDRIKGKESLPSPPKDTVKTNWKHLKSSPIAQKYFKQAFQQCYPATLLEEEKNRDFGEDLFGTLSVDMKDRLSDGRNPNERLDEMLPDDVDESRDRRLDIPLSREGRLGKNAYYYTRKMSILGSQGKIKEAIFIFEHWMMVRDRVMPNKRTFNVLIGILGRVGYMDKAFELYGKMRNLGLDPEDQVYTGLFNACANSPWPERALQRAENLFSMLQSNGVQLNLITVKAAVKAMAFCGNFPQAFAIMDEVATHTSLDTECFNHLLMACAADKQAGFSRAIQVWQKMQEFQIQPCTNSYNLLIRTARDCGIGNPDNFAKMLGLSSGKSKLHNHTHLLPLRHSLFNCDKGNMRFSLAFEVATKNLCINALDQKNHSLITNTENLTSSQEGHNLFHDIPNFDREINKFLTQRDAQRDGADSANMYEWWEDQPLDRQKQHEQQLSQESHADWTSEQNDYLTEEQLKALDVQSKLDDNLVQTWPTQLETTGTLKSIDSLPKSNDFANISSFCKTHITGVLQAPRDNTIVDEETMCVKDIATSTQRLALLGGAHWLVNHMSLTGVIPDVRTFSQLVPSLPDNEKAEDDLLCLMEETGISPDVDLINDIMMKRNLRHKAHTAKELLLVMSRLRLIPNMRTYAALALTCLKEQDAHRLLQDMKAANLEPTSEVMGHFIYISRNNFTYKLHMLKKMERMGLAPEPKTITVIEKSIAMTKKNIIAAEKKKDRSSFYLSTDYQESFRKFLHFYKGWLQRTSLHKNPHPWKAFEMNHTSKDETDDVKKVSTTINTNLF